MTPIEWVGVVAAVVAAFFMVIPMAIFAVARMWRYGYLLGEYRFDTDRAKGVFDGKSRPRAKGDGGRGSAGDGAHLR